MAAKFSIRFLNLLYSGWIMLIQWFFFYFCTITTGSIFWLSLFQSSDFSNYFLEICQIFTFLALSSPIIFWNYEKTSKSHTIRRNILSRSREKYSKIHFFVPFWSQPTRSTHFSHKSWGFLFLFFVFFPARYVMWKFFTSLSANFTINFDSFQSNA